VIVPDRAVLLVGSGATGQANFLTLVFLGNMKGSIIFVSTLTTIPEATTPGALLPLVLFFDDNPATPVPYLLLIDDSQNVV
jgi:hypothetical protein